ncbi:MAG: TetR/AcrR family transcriptional regulator [Micropepsaceae bacterium]
MDTRQRLIFSAMKLFAEKGYGSTSVADILREASANAGSLYHSFDTKQDLLLAVLDTYKAGIEPMLLMPAWEGVADPIERIFALLGAYRGMLEATECTYGCPIGSLALEIHEPDPPVRRLLSENFHGWVGHAETCLKAAADRLPRGTDTAALATFVLTVMEGGVMQARTHRSLAAFDACIATLRDYFNRLEESAMRERETAP